MINHGYAFSVPVLAGKLACRPHAPLEVRASHLTQKLGPHIEATIISKKLLVRLWSEPHIFLIDREYINIECNLYLKKHILL